MSMCISRRLSIHVLCTEDYSPNYNKYVRPVIYEGWHFTHTWETPAWRIISLSGDAWVHKSSLISPLSIEVLYQARKLSTHLFVCYLGRVPTV